ncbi:MAG: hypothetical protein ABJC61_10515 [Acidobacteriota bacterium]
MEQEIPRTSPAPRRRAPRRKAAGTRTPAAGADGGAGEVKESKPVSGEREQQAFRPSAPEVDRRSRNDTAAQSGERAFDELLASATSVRDLERLASDNPRTAVIGALAVGFVIGFGVGLLASKD